MRIAPGRVAVAPLSRRFVRGTVGVMRRHVDSSSFSIRVLKTRLKLDHDRLCGGLVYVANGNPTRFVQVVHLGHDGRLLGRDRGRVTRVTCRIKFDSPGEFAMGFGGRFKVSPSSCVHDLG